MLAAVKCSTFSGLHKAPVFIVVCIRIYHETKRSPALPGEFLEKAIRSLYESARLLAGVLVDDVQQFVIHRLPVLRRAGVERMGGAMRKMIAHQGAGHGAQRLLRRGDLSENVRAVAIVRDHARDSADLAFNPA